MLTGTASKVTGMPKMKTAKCRLFMMCSNALIVGANTAPTENPNGRFVQTVAQEWRKAND